MSSAERIYEIWVSAIAVFTRYMHPFPTGLQLVAMTPARISAEMDLPPGSAALLEIVLKLQWITLLALLSIPLFTLPTKNSNTSQSAPGVPIFVSFLELYVAGVQTNTPMLSHDSGGNSGTTSTFYEYITVRLSRPIELLNDPISPFSFQVTMLYILNLSCNNIRIHALIKYFSQISDLFPVLLISMYRIMYSISSSIDYHVLCIVD
jgi:hypothetical protein